MAEFKTEDVPGTVEYDRKQLRLLRAEPPVVSDAVPEPAPEPAHRRRGKTVDPEVTIESSEEVAPVAESEETT